MAIELDVKMKAPLSLESLVAAVSSALQDWFPQGQPMEVSASSGHMLEPDLDVELAMGQDAKVSVSVTNIGSALALGENAGAWITFSAGELRTPASVLLATLCAFAAARLTDGFLVDESSLLNMSRKPNAEVFWRRLEQISRSEETFSSAADRLFSHLFSKS